MATRAVDAAALTLVSDDALEEQLATEQVIDGLSRYHAPALELLDKRLATLTERPVLAARDNPVGPKFLAEGLGAALTALGCDHGRAASCCTSSSSASFRLRWPRCMTD
jgi:hypothetical protein